MGALKPFSELKNMAVYHFDGRIIGTLENILIDDEGKVLGFRIDKKGLFLRDCFFPISTTFFIKGNKLFISKDHLQPLADYKENCRQIDGQKGFIGRLLVNADDELKGIVEDVYFQYNLEKIVTIEISEGWFTDLKEGRKHIYYDDVSLYGENALLFKTPGGGACDEVPKLLQ